MASLVAHVVTNLPAIQETRIDPRVGKTPPGEGNGYPLKYFRLEKSIGRGVQSMGQSDMTE